MKEQLSDHIDERPSRKSIGACIVAVAVVIASGPEPTWKALLIAGWSAWVCIW
jgi:hypothetical protein